MIVTAPGEEGESIYGDGSMVRDPLTNPAGNGHVVVRDAFAVGSRAASSIVVERAGIVWYVTGFVVVRYRSPSARRSIGRASLGLLRSPRAASSGRGNPTMPTGTSPTILLSG